MTTPTIASADDIEARYPCADWCCSRGCPGMGSSLCASPPCDGSACTCGYGAIRDELRGARQPRTAGLRADLKITVEGEILPGHSYIVRLDRRIHDSEYRSVMDHLATQHPESKFLVLADDVTITEATGG